MIVSLKTYTEHIRNNPQGYWFKRKLYGWGWVPAKWQGWLVTLFFIAFISYIAFAFLINEKIIEYFFFLAISIAIFMYIAFKTGETPKWTWGK